MRVRAVVRDHDLVPGAAELLDVLGDLLEPLGGKALIVNGEYIGFGHDLLGSLFFIGPVVTPGGPHDDVHIAFAASSRARNSVSAFVCAARRRSSSRVTRSRFSWRFWASRISGAA